MKYLTQTHRLEYLRYIRGLANEELLEETLWLAQGDDYDGCFTHVGEWEYEMLKAELWARLRPWLEATETQQEPPGEA